MRELDLLAYHFRVVVAMVKVALGAMVKVMVAIPVGRLDVRHVEVVVSAVVRLEKVALREVLVAVDPSRKLAGMAAVA